MRRRVILMIAASLDGYIADRGGGVSWLPEGEAESGSETTFMGGIDTVVMGWNTYRQVVTELSPGQWPYEGLTCWVATHRSPQPRPGVHFFSGDLARQVRRLREQQGRGIWVCGGADVIRQLLEADLIDRLEIFVIPVLLGGGIRLFPELEHPLALELESAGAAGGMARLVYQRI